MKEPKEFSSLQNSFHSLALPLPTGLLVFCIDMEDVNINVNAAFASLSQPVLKTYFRHKWLVNMLGGVLMERIMQKTILMRLNSR